MRRTLQLANPHMRDGEDKTHPKDVSYTQRLLANEIHNTLSTNFHPGNADGDYGTLVAGAAKRAKYWYGYPKSQCVGTTGQVLINLLAGDSKMTAIMKWRRAYRVQLQKRHNVLRDKLVSGCAWGVRNSPSIHYSQGWLRMSGIGHPWMLPLFTDCSAWVTLLYNWCGGPDPNGMNFNHLGYTGTLLAHCIHIPKSALLPGDLVVFGAYPGHHTAMVVRAGTDPLLCSHGGEGDPKYISLSAEAAGQAANGHTTLTYLRVPGVS